MKTSKSEHKTKGKDITVNRQTRYPHPENTPLNDMLNIRLPRMNSTQMEKCIGLEKRVYNLCARWTIL